MEDQGSNPFRIVEIEGGRVQVTRHGDDSHFDQSQLRTFIIVADHADNPMSGHGVMVLEKILWAPELGAKIRLGEPNRDAEVVAQRYEVHPRGEFVSYVYVRDPQTFKAPRRSILTRLIRFRR